MTRKEALKELKETKTLTTQLLNPLGVSFEQFLKLAQANQKQQTIAINKLIKLRSKNV